MNPHPVPEATPIPSAPPRRRVRLRRVAVVGLLGAMTIAGAACSAGAADVSSSAGSSGASASSGASSAGATGSSTDASATTASAFFDSSTVHEISVEFDDAEYEAMLDTYSSTGEKEWISATITIDGTTYDNVGMRLKGNSSLRSVSSSADPEDLPWLIHLDEYVEGQEHEGVDEFVVRSNSSATSLNEAVALDLLEAAGLASQDAIATAFSVNGSDATLRLVVEHPDGHWMSETLSDTGALYKAESTGDYSYRGDDPEAYDDVFDQEAGDDNADLTPLIEFLDFVNNSDDATFASELDEHIDVDAFATYLAMQEILDNFDDIDGPGNNSYLYYDTETGQFTVVPWDMNLAFGARPGGAGGTMGGAGGFGGAPTGGAPTGGGGPAGLASAGATTTAVNAAVETAGPGGGMTRSNVLVERFLAVDDFASLYQEKLAQLNEELIESGRAAETLAAWVEVLEAEATDLVEVDTITSEAAAISRYF